MDIETIGAEDAEALGRLLSGRYSCRGFLSRQVPRPIIERILSLAQRTASWCNSQPWHVTILSGEETDRFRAALLTHVAEARPAPDFPWPREYRGVYRDRRRECGMQLYESVGIPRGDREAAAQQGRENYRLFGAPHVAIVTSDEALGVYGAIDCGAYVGNFILAARALGVASIAQAALATHPAFMRQYLGLGDDRLVVCGISFGYADEAHRANGFRTVRAPLDETVSWRG